MVWRWGDKRVNGLDPMWSVMNDLTRNTKDSVQVCSILNVAHVGVRRVTVVIVHTGHEEVVVVKYFGVAFFVRELLYQEVFSLHLPVGDSRLLSAVTDIFTINFAFYSC